MVRGEDLGEEKIHCKAVVGAAAAAACCCYERGVDIVEHMKWKKGTDGGGDGVGGVKKIKRADRCSRILCCTTARRGFKGTSAFCSAVVEKKKSKPMSVP